MKPTFLYMLLFLLPYTKINAQASYSLGRDSFANVGVERLFRIRTSSENKTVTDTNRVVKVFYEKNLLLSSELSLKDSSGVTVINYRNINIADSSIIPYLEAVTDTFNYPYYTVQLYKQKKKRLKQEDEMQVFTRDTSERNSKTHFAEIHGTISVIGSYSDNRYLFQQLPLNYTRANLETNLMIGGLPFKAGALYTTEANIINSYYFSFDYVRYQQMMRQRLEEKIAAQNRKAKQEKVSLQQIDIDKVNNEQAGILNKTNAKNYKDRLRESEEVIKLAEQDSLLKKTSRYKKALHFSEEHKFSQNKLKQLEQTKLRYKQIQRSEDVFTAGERIDMSHPGRYRRSLKKYGLYTPTYDIFSAVKKFDLGYFTPAYNRLVMDGVQVNGINIELNPGLLYFAHTSGYTVSNLNTLSFLKVQRGERQIHSSRVGLKKEGSFQAAVSLLKGKDPAINNEFADRSQNSNTVAGIDLSYHVADNIIFRAEYARSYTEAGVSKEPYFSLPEKQLTDEKNMSSAWLVSSEARLKQTSTTIELSYQSVDPFYYSFGTPYLRRDNKRFQGKISQPFLKDQLSVFFTYRSDRDNIYSTKGATTYTDFVSTGFKLKFKRYPFLIVSVSPVRQRFVNPENNRTFINRINVYSVVAGYTYRNKQLQNTTTINYISNNNISIADDNRYQDVFASNQFGLVNTLNHIATQTTLMVSCQYLTSIAGDSLHNDMIVYDITGAKKLWKNKVTVEAGYAYRNDVLYKDRRNVLKAGLATVIMRSIYLTARYEHHMMMNNKHMNIVNLSAIKSF